MTFLVNPPREIEVWADADGTPQRIGTEPLAGAVRPVLRWVAEVDWWSRPVSREYWRVLLREQLLCEIYRDREQEAWFVERIFD